MEYKIDKYIQKREDILINNKYEIIKDYNYNDDFHVVLYYLDDYKCKIIVRRLDSETGWDLNLCLKIYNDNDNDNDNEYQKISVGSSFKNKKIIIIFTKIKLYRVTYYEQKIPKIIIQTSKDNNYKNLLHYNAQKTFLELNPEYEYKFYDDNDCREFIKNNFNEDVLNTFDILNPGAYKADLFRYCYIYINGGCYFDNKYILRIPLHKIIKKDDDNIYCKDRGDDLMFNSIIMSVKNAIEFKNCIDNIVENVKNNFYGTISLEPTGPKLFNKYTFDKNILLQHIVIGNYYYDSKILIKSNNILFANTHYKGYYSSNNEQYEVIYRNKMLYYKNIQKINNYIILVYPNNHNDIFYFIIFYNKLIIKRIDQDCGWGQDLKIKIINNDNNLEYIYNIGKSIENEFILHISLL